MNGTSRTGRVPLAGGDVARPASWATTVTSIGQSLSSMKNMSDCVYPCPCGYYGDSQKPCTCAPAVVTKYQKRISGPLLDRIDIHIEVPRVDYEKLSGNRVSESSESIRATRASCARYSKQTLYERENHRHRLQCRHAYRGDPEILSVTG